MKLISEVQPTSMQEIVLLPEPGTSSLFGDFAFAQLFHPRALTTQQRLPIQKSTDPIGALDEGWSTQAARSEERRVGKVCVSTCRSRWSPFPKKKNKNEPQK